MAKTHLCELCGESIPDGASGCPHCATTLNFEGAPALLPEISGYRILELIGRGGMGSVHLAEETALGRTVAIKRVTERFSGKGQALERFAREARALATVEHPRVVRIYAFGRLEGVPCIVMEHVRGKSLAQLLKAERRLSVESALRYSLQAVEALEAAWERGVVHRDIKPSNILLDSRDDVRLVDFGLAKPRTPGDELSLTRSGAAVGTPYYTSPEQARGKMVDFRADLYSLGIVLFEMLAGRPPFTGNTPFEILEKHARDRLPSLDEQRPGIHAGIVRLVERMTSKNPEDRPGSHREVREELEALLNETRAAGSTGEPENTAGARPGDSRADRPPPNHYYGALLVLAVALTGWFALTEFGRRADPGRGPAASESRLVLAIAPFYGPDQDSLKEGRVMAALIERSVKERLGEAVSVIGIEETGRSVRDHESARKLGEDLGATAVLWGEAFALRAESEIQPYLTIVPGREGAGPQLRPEAGSADEGSFLEGAEMAAEATLVNASSSRQIELRKVGAGGVGEMVSLLAATHALTREQNAEKALRILRKTTESADSLLIQSRALDRLGRRDEAMEACRAAVDRDPSNAQVQAQLGDLLAKAGRWPAAAQAYTEALDRNPATPTSAGTMFEGKLYLAEKYDELLPDRSMLSSTLYLLEVDPGTGQIMKRLLLPGPAVRFEKNGLDLEITYHAYGSSNPVIKLRGGELSRPVATAAAIGLVLNSLRRGWQLAGNFVTDFALLEAWDHDARFALNPARMDPRFPASLPELEEALRERASSDPTEPWHLLFLGEALDAQGEREKAEAVWSGMMEGAFPSIPFYEYAWIAAFFESFQQTRWADLAFQESLRRRKGLPQEIKTTSLNEKVVLFPALKVAARAPFLQDDPARQHLWLERCRRLLGIDPDDYLIARLWERYFRSKGSAEQADREAEVMGEAGDNPYNVLVQVVIRTQVFRSVCAAASALALLVLAVYWRAARSVAGSSQLASGSSSRLIRFPAWARRMAVALVVVFLLWKTILAGIATYWRPGHLQRVQPLALIDLALLLALAAVALISVPNWKYRPLRVIPLIPAAHRWAIVALLILTISLAAWHTAFEPDTYAYARYGTSLSQGTDESLAMIERELREHDAPRTRFVGGVFNHLAGYRKRARDLYLSIPEDERAAENLDSLESGSLTPPHQVSPEDLASVLGSYALDDLLAKLWISAAMQIQWSEDNQVANMQRALALLGMGSILTVFPVLAALMAVSFLLISCRDSRSGAPARSPRGPAGRWLDMILPGAFDLLRGSPLLGWMICFLVLGLLYSVAGRMPVSDTTRPGYVTVAVPPIPLPPSTRPGEIMGFVEDWHGIPQLRRYWVPFLLSGLAGMLIHIGRLRAIYRD